MYKYKQPNNRRMHLDNDDKQWFASIFDQHYEHIRNYVYYLSGDITLSEDLSQDAFLQIWEERKSLNRATARSYLFTIVRHNYFKHYRRKAVKINFINAQIREEENESPEFILELKEFDHLLQRAIAKIPDKTRAIFLMSRIDSMSYANIAHDLNISQKTVEKHITKALKLLKKKVNRKL
ncbi:RNA polymerase sigma-70 factor [Mangrovibacterium marinum]|uniref:RNA polymerase sigma factor n=1 Tax=Mangrovibacterium marinum TaxID=1639118 RepID=UPI002A18A5B7|nr:RNA polymerase sigma-70 factor [Mangrovibacterium marinum]